MLFKVISPPLPPIIITVNSNHCIEKLVVCGKYKASHKLSTRVNTIFGQQQTNL